MENLDQSGFVWIGDFNDRNVGNLVLNALNKKVRTFKDLAEVSTAQLEAVGLDGNQCSDVMSMLIARGLESSGLNGRGTSQARN